MTDADCEVRAFVLLDDAEGARFHRFAPSSTWRLLDSGEARFAAALSHRAPPLPGP